MSNTYWNLDDGNGNSLFEGMNEVEARRAAQRIANERGESVWLYEVGNTNPERAGSGEPDTEIESEEIAPELS